MLFGELWIEPDKSKDIKLEITSRDLQYRELLIPPSHNSRAKADEEHDMNVLLWAG